MRRLSLLALTLVLALTAVSLSTAQRKHGPDGAFQSLTDYAVAGQWLFSRSSSPVCFEGATDDANKTCFTFADPTATRTITFPNESGSVSVVSPAPVNVTGSTLTLSADLHGGRTVTLNRAAGIAITLPAATGSGTVYRLVIGTTFTGDATVAVASGTDYMLGTALLDADAGDTVVGFATANTGTVATESDILDLFDAGNVTGGINGGEVVLIDMGANQWYVRYTSDAAGAEATPFKVGV